MTKIKPKTKKTTGRSKNSIKNLENKNYNQWIKKQLLELISKLDAKMELIKWRAVMRDSSRILHRKRMRLKTKNNFKTFRFHYNMRRVPEVDNSNMNNKALFLEGNYWECFRIKQSAQIERVPTTINIKKKKKIPCLHTNLSFTQQVFF